MRRMSRAGFKMEFVRPAILPNWWNEECEEDSSLLQEIDIRVARFLGLPLSTVQDPSAALVAPAYPNAQLRRVRDVDRDRLGPAIHSAIRIAAAAVRSLRDTVPQSVELPSSGLAWREQIKRPGTAVTLQDILSDLWLRGIPIIPLDVFPSPSFQGVTCIVEGRPVVVLGHKHDQPGRVAFFVAHEAGHIAARDCAPDRPVVDEEEEIIDDTEIERRADQFATQVLVGDDGIPFAEGADFKELAKQAYDIERASGADASAIIYSWARQTGDYATASMAVKALYRSTGARQQLRSVFDKYIDLNAATESDRDLLRCVHGDPEQDEAAD